MRCVRLLVGRAPVRLSPMHPEAACVQRFDPIREATPIPRRTAEELGIAPYVVGVVDAGVPMAPLEIPPHPYLDNGGDSRVHNDHYNSAAYNRDGPIGPAIDVTTHLLGQPSGVCAMLTMLEDGYVIGTCLVSKGGNGVQVMLTMFDNLNLDIVAEYDLGFRPFVPNSAGGAYFSLDGEDNIIVGPATNRLEQYHIEVVGGAPVFVQDYAKEIPGLAPAMEVTDPMLQDTVIDYEGRIWFMITDGRVGYYDRETDTIEMTDLERELENSMVVDDRGVYFVMVGATARVSRGLSTRLSKLTSLRRKPGVSMAANGMPAADPAVRRSRSAARQRHPQKGPGSPRPG